MWWFCDVRFNSCLVRPTRVIFFLAAFHIMESAKHTLRGGAVWSARRAHNPKVAGSNPAPATQAFIVYAQIAQLVEQRTENPRVTGSIPVLGIFICKK